MQKVNPLIFRSGIHGFWKSKFYPNNYTFNLIKTFNIYKVLRLYFFKNSYFLIGFKYLFSNYLSLYTYIYNLDFEYNTKNFDEIIRDSFLSYYGNSWFELTYILNSGFFGKFNVKIKTISKNNWFYEASQGLAHPPEHSYRLIKKKTNKIIKYKLFKQYEKKLIKKETILFKIKLVKEILYNLKYRYIKFIIKNCLNYKKKLFNSIINYKNLIYNQILKKKNYNIICTYFLEISHKYYDKLFFKIKSIELEYIIKEYFNIDLNLKIVNISQIFKFEKFNNIPQTSIIYFSSRLSFFKDLLRCFFFSICFKNSYILCHILARHISNYKKHFSTIKNMTRIIKTIMSFEKTNNFSGIRIRVHGKFHGILKKRFHKTYIGRKSLHRMSTNVSYSLNKSYTRFGVFSIKVWLFYKF